MTGERPVDGGPAPACMPMVAAGLIALAACSGGADTPIAEEGLAVHDVRVGEPVGRTSAGVYARIENGGPDDALVDLASPLARRGSLHATETAGGMTTMRAIASMPIPGGDRLELLPGARHGMLEELERDLAVGDTVEVVFLFDSGTRIAIAAPVVSRLELAGRDAAAHDAH